VTLRIFSPYGPGDHERRLIPYLVHSFLSGEAPKMTTGKQQWDFVYVEDIVEAYVKVLRKQSFPTKHEVFNIGSGEAVSIREIALRLKEILQSDLTPVWGAVAHRENELWHVCADIQKAQTVLGWRPQTKILDDGLKRTVESLKNPRAMNKVVM
jgi:nucleoside-diphosphate-sugar epimerase